MGEKKEPLEASLGPPDALSDTGSPPGLLSQQVADHIRRTIIYNEMRPGERIREHEIAKSLGVSRTPFRDALRILEMERLIKVTPNRGAEVVRHSEAEIADMLTVYSELEVLGGCIACRLATESDIGTMRCHYDALVRAFENEERAAYFAANQEFHLSIVAASHNATLVSIYRHLNLRLFRIRYLSIMQLEDWAAAAGEHADLVLAVAERDSDQLARLLRRHMTFAWRSIDRDCPDNVLPAPNRPDERWRRKQTLTSTMEIRDLE